MSLFVDTLGNSTLGVGLCARCSRKFALDDLSPDPNSPGLMVCKADLDQYDPYRLQPRGEDQVTLPFVRPDASVATQPSGVIVPDGTEFVVTEGGGYLFIID